MKNRMKKYFAAAVLGLTLAFPAFSPAAAADFPDHILPETTTIYFQRADQLIFIPNLLQTPVNRSLARSPFIPNFHKVSLVLPAHSGQLFFSYGQSGTNIADSSYDNNLLAPGNLFFIPQRTRQLEIGGDYQLGQFYVSSEFTWDLAEIDRPGNDTAENITFKLDAGQNFGNLQTGIMYYYASADDGSFNLLPPRQSPAYILNNSYGIMQADLGDTGEMIKENGIHTIILHSDLALNNRLNLHGGLAYGLSAADSKNSYGMEVDVGASYAIFDNLIYEVRLGYLNMGNVKHYDEASNPEDMYLLTHHLTLEF